MRIAKSGDFWIGLILGAILLYVYTNHMKKGSSGG